MNPFQEEKNVLIVDQDKNCVGFILYGIAYVIEDECKKGLKLTFVKVEQDLYESNVRDIMRNEDVVNLHREDFDLEGV